MKTETTSAPTDLKRRTTRGAFSSLAGQGLSFVLRLGSLVILARLLSPRDFGLVGMATAITGILVLFQDAGLSNAAIQSASITREQTSTLFWINVAIGFVFASLVVIAAPFLATFYREPRVAPVAYALASTFLFFGASAQHRAMLVRNMKISTLAIADLIGSGISVSIAITLALLGAGYWALVGLAVVPPLFNLIAVWFLGRWLPGFPSRTAGIGKMIKYGGTLMLDSAVMYFAYNTDKILLGRFLGAEALGLYGRAYQLVNIPTATLSSVLGATLFPVLSRLQEEPERLRNYFLKSYTLFLSLAMPVTVACGLFGEDIIRVFLGPKWIEAAPIFRLLAPTILAFALINPTGLLLYALGRVIQGLWIGLMIAPVVIAGYAFGLSYGPVGVAGGFSGAMLLLIVPSILWGVRGTPVSSKDVFRAIFPPLSSVVIAGVLAGLVSIPAARIEIPFFRLVVENVVLFGVHAALLYFVLGQKALYLSVFSGLGLKFRRRAAAAV